MRDDAPPDGQRYGGIDLGGTKIQAVVVDDDHNVLGSARRPTPTSGGPEDVAERDGARAARRRQGRRDRAGAARRDRGRLARDDRGRETSPARATCPTGKARSRSRPTLRDAHSGWRCEVGNDVQVATDAEVKLGAGRPYGSLLGVFWGTGVGGGMILDGKPWTGRGGAGEIGHMVVEIDGARCTCGRRGCMEAYAGRAAMEAHARELHEEKGRKTDLFKLMKRARPHAPDERHLGAGARSRRQARRRRSSSARSGRSGRGSPRPSTCSTSRRVIIGGGLGVRLGDPYAERIADAMQPHLFADSRPPHVHVAALGDLGGAIGAALLLRARRGPRDGVTCIRLDPAGGAPIELPAQPAARPRGRAARSRRGPDRALGRRRLPAGDGREGEDRRARAVRARGPDRLACSPARCASRGRS